MTLQLHKPDGKGGLEKRAVQDGDWRRHLRAALGLGAAQQAGAPAGQSRDEPDVHDHVGPVLARPGPVLTFVVLVVGYGIGFWHLAPPG